MDDEPEGSETAEDEPEVLESTKNLPPGRVCIELRIADILCEPGPNKRLLVVRQPLDFLREVRNEEKEGRGACGGHETLSSHKVNQMHDHGESTNRRTGDEHPPPANPALPFNLEIA